MVAEKVVDTEEKSQVTLMAKTGLIKERREKGEKKYRQLGNSEISCSFLWISLD